MSSVLKSNFLFILLLTSLILSGQHPTFDRSVCWEISKLNTPSSFLVGSIHQIDTSSINFPIDTLQSLIDRCQSVVVELITQDSIDQMSLLMKHLFLTSTEKNMVNSLDEVRLAKLNQIVDSSAHFLVYFKSILQTVNPTVFCFMMEAEKQLSNSKLVTKATFQPETHFLTYAKSKGYAIHQLETFQQQMDYLLQPDIPFEEAMDDLKATIDNYHKPDTLDIFQQYIDQNLMLADSSMFTDPSLVKRNQVMADGMDQLINKAPAFIMIGAAHLPYDYGVLNLLQRKGYQLKPYKLEFSPKATNKLNKN